VCCGSIVQLCYVLYSQPESLADNVSHAGSPVALGTKRTASSLVSVPQMCILCQEEQELTHTGRSLVLCAYVQRYECTLCFLNLLQCNLML